MSLFSHLADMLCGSGRSIGHYYQDNGRPCAICGATTIPTFDVIEKTLVGSAMTFRPVAVCSSCAPPCRKCGWPLHNPKLHALLDKLRTNRSRNQSFTWRFKSCAHGVYAMPYGYVVGEEFTSEENRALYDSDQTSNLTPCSKIEDHHGIHPDQTGNASCQPLKSDTSLDLSCSFAFSVEEDIARLRTLQSVILNNPLLHGSHLDELLSSPSADLEDNVSLRCIRNAHTLEQAHCTLRASPVWTCIDPVLLEKLLSVMGQDSSSFYTSMELAERYKLPRRVFRYLHSTEYNRLNALTLVAFSWYELAIRLLTSINSSPKPWLQVEEGKKCLRLACQADHTLVSASIALIISWDLQSNFDEAMRQLFEKERARMIANTEKTLLIMQINAMSPKTRGNLNEIQILVAQNASRYLDIIRQVPVDFASS